MNCQACASRGGRRSTRLGAIIGAMLGVCGASVAGGSEPQHWGEPRFCSQYVITGRVGVALSLDAADLDGDGDLDALLAAYSDGMFVWHENLGDGGFGPEHVIDDAPSSTPSGVHASDLDGDGDMDCLTGTLDDVAWYENLGGGAFGPRQVITAEADAFHIASSADLDGDGDADVIVWLRNGDSIDWYENAGDGTFGPRHTIDGDAETPASVRAVDLDGDGDLDLIAAGGRWSAWYENQGAGVFGTRQRVGLGPASFGVDAADLDGDGDLDVWTTGYGQPVTSWYENQGGGAFAARPVDLGKPIVVRGGDVDGDGDVDLLAGGGEEVVWHLNAGDGTFDPNDRLPVTGMVYGVLSLLATDWDVDGDVDVMFADFVAVVACANQLIAPDCNGNHSPDGCDAVDGLAEDCDGNGLPDECELGTMLDCNSNLVPDRCDIDDGTSVDCNGNFAPDECDVADGTSPDCNANDVPDECDIAAGTSSDCNANGVPDACDLSGGASADCNANGVPDECDIAGGTSSDCNVNGVPDACDLEARTSRDCNHNDVPDECDEDCDGNGVADDCDPDCNANGVADACDIAAGTSVDANANGAPDECEPGDDCNRNDVPDATDIADGTSADCNANGVPDECDVAGFGEWAPRGAGADVLADLDSDGDEDIVAYGGGESGNDLVWYENIDGGVIGGERFIAREQIAETAADIDADGDVDLLTLRSWIPNLGGGVFGAERSFGVEISKPMDIVACDFDDNGRMDLIIASVYRGLNWYSGDGTGFFHEGVELDDGGSPRLIRHLLVADFDQDGDLDPAWFRPDSIKWRENLGGGAMGDVRTAWSGEAVLMATVGDVDGDGDADIVSAYGPNAYERVLKYMAWRPNLGDGAFGPTRALIGGEPGTRWDGESYLPRPVIADFDRDGIPDVAAIWQEWSIQFRTHHVLYWFRGLGGGELDGARIIDVGVLNGRFHELHAADLTGDGVVDIVAESRKGLMLYENQIVSRDVNFNGVPDECEGVFGTGDLNCDGVVDTFDVDSFILALSDPPGYAAAHPACDINLADCDGDGFVDTYDIDDFVALMAETVAD